MSEEPNTTKKLSEDLKKKGLNETYGTVALLKWGAEEKWGNEKTYVLGSGKIKAEEDGISIYGKDIELIKDDSKEKRDKIEHLSGLIYFFEEKTNPNTIEEARKIIKAEIDKDKKGKRS